MLFYGSLVLLVNNWFHLYRGTTHFCEPCHAKECRGERVSTYTKDKLPLCKGKDTCALKLEHKPNGEECSLGCSICRNIVENAKDFWYN